MWLVRTGRLQLSPVAWADLPELSAIKADPRVYALMLGGVRSAIEVARDLAEDTAAWGEHGIGIWAVRPLGGGKLQGLTGFQHRPDGRGLGLRFAFWPEAQGRGYAREAAAAALRFAHDTARIPRVVAVARESNIASRTLLGGIGMTQSDRFDRAGETMLEYESKL
jgi:RimJ/RimL family protein N-acetyltransferase